MLARTAASTFALFLFLAGARGLAQDGSRSDADSWPAPPAPVPLTVPMPRPSYAPTAPSPLVSPRDRWTNDQRQAPSRTETVIAPPITTTTSGGSKGFAVFESSPPITASKSSNVTETRGWVTFQPTSQAMPQPGAAQRPAGEESLEYQIQLQPPGPQRLFRLESEPALQERMRQEARERPVIERIVFPEEPAISGGPTHPRPYPPSAIFVEPNYTCYGHLYFEQKNFERYGWDLCFLTPFVSGAAFCWDLATLPMHIFTCPLQRCECNTGYCLPGDPVPLQLYPPNLTLTGVAAEAGIALTIIAIF